MGRPFHGLPIIAFVEFGGVDPASEVLDA